MTDCLNMYNEDLMKAFKPAFWLMLITGILLVIYIVLRILTRKKRLKRRYRYFKADKE